MLGRNSISPQRRGERRGAQRDLARYDFIVFIQAQDKPVDATIFQHFDLEVEKKSGFPIANPHVSQSLCFKDWVKSLNGFDFNDDGVFYKQIQLVRLLYLDTFVF